MTRLPHTQTNAGDSMGMAVDQHDVSIVFSALDALPPRCRDAIVHASIPISTVDLEAQYRHLLEMGYPQRIAENAIIKAVEMTDAHYAAILEKERATWNIGEEMARSIKAVTAKLRGAKQHAATATPDSA